MASTIAASNFDLPGSFVGENFSYRPYFQDAVAGRQSPVLRTRNHLAETRLLFCLADLCRRGPIRGVIVFKVDIDID